MKYSKILGTGSYLPNKVLTNFDLEKSIDTTDEWIYQRTGIKERRIAAPEETVADMAFEAANEALSVANVTPRDIDGIIVATCSAEYIFPSTACQVQHKLNMKHGFAFDVQAACSGFIYALSVADSMIKAGNAKNILVIGAEAMSKILDWKDRATCILFGDGAGACVVSESATPGIVSTSLHSDGEFKEVLYLGNFRAFEYEKYLQEENNFKPKAQMQGNTLFKLAVNMLGEVAKSTLENNNLGLNGIDWLVPHQANIRIINAMAEKLGLDMSKVVITLDKQGNTSGASIPLALDAAMKGGKIKTGQTVLLESFGAGLTWGTALIKF